MRTLFEINHTIPKLLLLALLSSSWLACTASAQWVAYTFSPRAAYLVSYGLSTNTTNNTSTIQTVILSNGWANAQTAAGTIVNSNATKQPPSTKLPAHGTLAEHSPNSPLLSVGKSPPSTTPPVSGKSAEHRSHNPIPPAGFLWA